MQSTEQRSMFTISSVTASLKLCIRKLTGLKFTITFMPQALSLVYSTISDVPMNLKKKE